MNRLQIIHVLEIQPPYGGFFLAPAESCSLQLQQKGPSGQKVILRDGRTDGRTEGRTTGLRELDVN